MKVPLSWLRDFVDITLPIDELVHRLNMSGTEVEGLVEIGADWDQVVVCKVVELVRHPDADSLFVARLDAGSQGLATVVTGATNVHVGALVPLIRPGGRLPGGREIAAQELRGIVSEGMLCSGDELGLSADRSGIYLLEDGGEPGQPLRDLLGETVLDLYITPNRPDCMSVFGVAREIHALTGAPLRRPTPAFPIESRTSPVTVEILDPDLGRRFTAAYIADVTIGPSPAWLQRRLHLAGVRPISNVVDATNYTMLELGQPQHAFDADQLGDTIVVRRAAAGERIVTLDGVERELDGQMLVIADAIRPVGVAGVMGGGPTEVSDTTRNVILETANFTPSSIRRTSRELRLASEASRRYERGIDPDLARFAATRTVGLLVELTGGRLVDGIADEYPNRPEPNQILVHEDEIAALLGRPYSRTTIAEVLGSLDFTVESRGDRMLVTVPGHRPDVEGRADLAEEVARITGYDVIPDTLPTGAPPEPLVDPLLAAAEHAKDVLVGSGLHEVMTYSLVAPDSIARLTGTAERGPAGESGEGIVVANPISEEHCVLRTTLLPSLIEAARANLRHQIGVAIFEAARVYLPPLSPLPTEQTRLAIVMVGSLASSWATPRRQYDFFDLKGALEALLGSFGLRARVGQATSPEYHPGRCAELFASVDGSEERWLGLLGQLHPEAAERFDLRGREVYVAELDFDRLSASAVGQGQIQALPRFPGLDRDLALILDQAVSNDVVERALRAAGGGLLESVRLFDVYEGSQLSPGQKSLAYSLRFRSPDRTLTDDEADDAVGRMISAVAERFGATVRGR